jgi:Flp pilus assembly protein protease CpaA
MELLLWREIVLLLGTLLAGIVDLKTGFIYDWISYPLIGLGLLFNILEFGFGIELVKIFGLGFLVFFLGYILYYYGKIGGGDVKLFTGVFLLLPFFHGQIFLLNVLVWAAVLALLALPAYYLAKLFLGGKKIKIKKEDKNYALLIMVLFLIYSALTYYYRLFSLWKLFVLALAVLIVCFFVLFKTEINKRFFVKRISLKEIEDDEVVALDFMGEMQRTNFLRLFGERRVFGPDDKKKLEKLKFKEIYVYRGLPRFGVFVFFGILIALTLPDLLLRFLMA